MINPFKKNQLVLTAADVFAFVGRKEAELLIAREQLRQAAQMIEQLKAKLDSAKSVPNTV